MSEDRELEAELQAKIASLSGRINLHKQSAQRRHSFQSRYSNIPGHEPSSPGRTFPRGTPYNHARGGGPKIVKQHRNRSLVLNSTGQGNPESGLSDATGSSGPEMPPPMKTDPSARSLSWVSKRDRHMQLINAAVYDELSQRRIRSLEDTSAQKRLKTNLRERAKLKSQFQGPALQTYQPITESSRPSLDQGHQVVEIDNVQFKVINGGSKLIRVSHDPNTARATPKQATIAGVKFFRSKNGNLYRSGLVNDNRSRNIRKLPGLCPKFTSTGTCSKGPKCRYTHDPSRVAICKEYLQKGACQSGDACDLSHKSIPERVPACLHFLRGNCTNEHCRYAHVRVNPGAPVCWDFATLGYCTKGPECAERHVFECPDYANKGNCRNKKCRLPHVDRAGQIRKAAAQAVNAPDEDESSDISSDEDYDAIDSDDVDSEELDEDIDMQDTNHPERQDLSLQHDFVHL